MAVKHDIDHDNKDIMTVNQLKIKLIYGFEHIVWNFRNT